MKIRLDIGFRRPADEVVCLLPADLAFFRDKLQDYGSFHLSQSGVGLEASPELVERIIDWGREEHKGLSIIRVLAISEDYARLDLEGQAVVEILLGGAGAPYDSCEIKNFKKAFAARWDCNYCRRIAWHQVADYEIGSHWTRDDEQKTGTRSLSRFDFLDTMNHDFLASPRIQEMLKPQGVDFRPLKNSARFAQVMVTETCRVEINAPPIILFAPCPACGRSQGVGRNRTLEGDPFPLTPDGQSTDPACCKGITILQDRPLTVALPAAGSWAIAKTDIEFGGFYGEGFYGKPSEHKAGERVKLERRHFARGCPCYYFVKGELMRQWLDMGIKELAFRPVNIV